MALVPPSAMPLPLSPLPLTFLDWPRCPLHIMAAPWQSLSMLSMCMVELAPCHAESHHSSRKHHPIWLQWLYLPLPIGRWQVGNHFTISLFVASLIFGASEKLFLQTILEFLKTKIQEQFYMSLSIQFIGDKEIQLETSCACVCFCLAEGVLVIVVFIISHYLQWH